MAKFLNRMMNEYENEEESIITPKNARIAAVLLCVFFVVIGLAFGDFLKSAKGVFLGGAKHPQSTQRRRRKLA